MTGIMRLLQNLLQSLSTRLSSPTPDQIRAARLAAGLNQNEAASLIISSKRSWENWEQGRVNMHPGLFDYFLIQSGQKNLRIDENTPKDESEIL